MPLTRSATEAAMAVPDSPALQARIDTLRHPLLSPISIDLRKGLTPTSAAVFAVIVNPTLRADRNRRSLASAQLLQAGLLPNPSLDFTVDPVTGGNTLGTSTGYLVGVSWDITALISHDAKVAAASAASQSIQLDVAWQEWQYAQAARKAVFDRLALAAQFDEAALVDKRLADNAALVRRAVDEHQKTLLDLAAADAASQKAHADFLAVKRDLRHQVLALNQVLGLPPDASVPVMADSAISAETQLPSEAELMSGIEDHRLDLLALRRGYESQEQALRAAVLAQFPRIVIGFHQASDTTNVHTTGFGITVDLPIFDRNQGAIAIETATRQRLFDEYVTRSFESRSAIAQSLEDIHSLTEQIAAAEMAIPALARLVKTYQLAVEQRNVDVLSYYSARNDLSQKRIDLLKLKQQLVDNRIVLEIASGRYLPGTATTQPASKPATAEARE